jgi:small subunit ribosomal protein S9|tara:strand:+ start:94 stop:519 length:426 start_codon:yes stop_codon:yes gene_type:complete
LEEEITLVKRKMELFSGSRKRSHATAAITPGTGKVRINSVPVEVLEPRFARERIMIPLELSGSLRDKINISVDVSGGGFMGQADASAISISRALTNWFKKEDLKKRLTEYDKHLLSGDHRRKEPKKFGGPGARRRKQKSYR